MQFKYKSTAQLKNQSGFTMIELLITLLLSSVLMVGLSLAYSSISGLIHTSKNLENSQEVIRYSAEVFSRSLKQTTGDVTAAANQLTVAQNANAVACDGTRPTAAFTEVFALDGNNLQCNINAVGPVTILTGIESMTFSLSSSHLFSVEVKPLPLIGETTTTIQIDVALSGKILMNVLGS